MDPSVFFIIFNGIFYQIGDCQRQLYFIHLCRYRAKALKYYFNIPGCRNRPQPLQDPFHQCINILRRDIHSIRCLIHLHQRQKIINNLILTLDLLRKIAHKLFIKLRRHLFLRQERVRQHLHRGQRCFQLMRHIGDKLISGIIQDTHPSQHLIKCLRQRPRLCISIFIEIMIVIPFCNRRNRPRDPLERSGHHKSQEKRQHQHHQYHGNPGHISFPIQHGQIILNRIRGDTDQQDAQHCLPGCVKDRRCHFDIGILFIIIAGPCPFQTMDHVCRNNRLPDIHIVCIFFHLEIPIDHQHASIVNIGHLYQLCTDRFSSPAIQRASTAKLIA